MKKRGGDEIRDYVRQLWERREEFGWETKIQAARDLAKQRLIVPGREGWLCFGVEYFQNLLKEKS